MAEVNRSESARLVVFPSLLPAIAIFDLLILLTSQLDGNKVLTGCGDVS